MKCHKQWTKEKDDDLAESYFTLLYFRVVEISSHRFFAV